MSFYHVNSDIYINDILKLCNFKSFDIDRSINLRSFVRPDIASKDDITFINNVKYITTTQAEFIITKKELINSIVGNQVALISDNVERDIAKISNLFSGIIK